MAREKISCPAGDRNAVILSLLRVRRSIKIAELQEILGVSDMTVRRCLNEMAAEGHLKRVHGGAVIVDPWDKDLRFQNRIAEHLEVKLALAKQVQPFIPEGGSIFLDGGTTCFEIAKQLSLEEKKCTVITNNIAVVRELLGKPLVESILLGGKLSADGNTLDGPVATETASKISVDLCIFSCDSFNDCDVQNQSLTESQHKKVMMRRAALSMCVTASHKYGKNRCFQFCEWNEIDIFITGNLLPAEAREAIASQGVEVHLVEAEPINDVNQGLLQNVAPRVSVDKN